MPLAKRYIMGQFSKTTSSAPILWVENWKQKTYFRRFW
jgi:hypothetical protein